MLPLPIRGAIRRGSPSAQDVFLPMKHTLRLGAHGGAYGHHAAEHHGLGRLGFRRRCGDHDTATLAGNRRIGRHQARSAAGRAQTVTPYGLVAIGPRSTAFCSDSVSLRRRAPTTALKMPMSFVTRTSSAQASGAALPSYPWSEADDLSLQRPMRRHQRPPSSLYAWNSLLDEGVTTINELKAIAGRLERLPEIGTKTVQVIRQELAHVLDFEGS